MGNEQSLETLKDGDKSKGDADAPNIGAEIQLQERVKTHLGWTDNGDNAGIKMDLTEKKLHNFSKHVLYTQSVYFKSCFDAEKDPFPKVTERLIDPLPEVRFTWKFVMHWLAKSHANSVYDQTFEQWYEEQAYLSTLEWTQIFVTAESLGIQRLMNHVGAAITMTVQDTHILPCADSVVYVWLYGKLDCPLKIKFTDMYGIAAMELDDYVFGNVKDSFPQEFIDDVTNYEREEAYVYRKREYKECVPPAPRIENESEDL